MSVPKGSIVTYQCKALTTFSDTAADVENAVASSIEQAGLLVVDNSITNTSLLDQLGYGLSSSIPFSMTLQIQTQQDFNQATDIQSIVDHAVYVETGSLPSSSSVPYVQVPGGTAQSTGTPAQGSLGTTSAPQTLTQKISSLFSSITTGGTTMLALFCFGIIVALVLITGAGGVARRAA